MDTQNKPSVCTGCGATVTKGAGVLIGDEWSWRDVTGSAHCQTSGFSQRHEVAGDDTVSLPPVAIKPEPKTSEQVQDLMQQWYADPSWDIEKTEGFEAHADELKRFRRSCEREWQQARRAHIEFFAQKLGLPDSLKLAEYVMGLEARIAKLELKI